MRKASLVLIVTGLIAALGLAACGGVQPASTRVSPPTSSSAGNLPPTANSSSNGNQPGENPTQTTDENGVPADFPVIDGAYNLQVVRGGQNITFQVDGDIQKVMTFYQEQLPGFGWEDTRAPDSAVGAIGSMTRKNQAGDNLSINLSYNANGEFVIVQIAIIRAQ